MTHDLRLDAVFRAIRLVEHQLRSPINVKDMAAEAGYSLYHFCAVFSQYAGHSPYDYLIRRRMTEAGKKLLDGDHRILDIAVEFQFDSHEGFTRAYKRMFGCPPSISQQNGCLPYLACLEPLTEAHLLCLQQAGRFTPTEIKEWEPQSGNPQILQTCYPHKNPPKAVDSSAEQLAVFNLPETINTTLACDWILHTWLFFSHYQLSGNVVYQPKASELVLPINKID